MKNENNEFWAYLWGIETRAYLETPQSPSGFEPTYEELKLQDNPTKPTIIQRFEPTYEELKHALAKGVGMEQIGFEPTYEELKLPFMHS